MSSPFAITAATNTVSLDNNRQGETSFTVSNMTGHPIRGRARLVVQPATASPWVTLEGETEREFASDGSQQYRVQISVPPATPPGDYIVRLDMANTANPDEDFSQGPTVKFVVPAPLAVKKPFPWWIVAVAVALVILLGAGIYGIVHATHKTTTTTTTVATRTPPTPSPTPTPTPVLHVGSWQGQFTNVATNQSPLQVLQISAVQQNAFNGLLIESCPFTGEGTRSIEITVTASTGSLKQFNSAAQGRLQYAITQFGNGTQNYVEFTAVSYFASGCNKTDFAVNSVFDAVVYPDGSLHGVWFNPGDTAPTGTFILNKRT